MPVNFQSTPVTNQMVPAITFRNGAMNLATLQPGAVAVLTITFDRIIFAAAFHPLVQNPNVAVAVQPGSFAYILEAGGRVLLKYATLNGTQQTVYFD